MENIDTVSIRISNKQISSIIDDSITRTTSLKKSSSYLSDILSFKSEKLQSLVSRIANDQTAKLVNIARPVGFENCPSPDPSLPMSCRYSPASLNTMTRQAEEKEAKNFSW